MDVVLGGMRYHWVSWRAQREGSMLWTYNLWPWTVHEKAARKSLDNIKAVLVDSYDAGIQSSSVDIVLVIDAIHSITDYDALFHEIHRILKPGGLLFVDPGDMRISKARDIVTSSACLQ